MMWRRSLFRCFVGYALIFSVSGVAICSGGAPGAARNIGGRAGHGSMPANHLPCKCDLNEKGCCCGGACCCKHSAPKPAPAAPVEQSQRVVRQPLVLQVLAAMHAGLALGPLAVDPAAPVTLVSLTPTLQLEHVRIQT
jgi:hypothetical protein